MKPSLIIHGHFYQPPRENPWTATIDREPSAHPYHDWNERITAECYAPNGASRILDTHNRIVKIVNNYARINFNFGPTLLSWLAEKVPETYRDILAADSLSAMKHAHVKVLRDETGLAVDYAVDGDFPTFGNNDDRADAIAVDLVELFMAKIRRQPAYRGAEPTLSVLTITSNVVYGKNTGNTPDGRRAGEPFAPGANPMNGRDRHGLVAAALSAAKLPYRCARDGISLTTTVTPDGLGHSRDERIGNLAGVLDGYIDAGGFHLNVNVLRRETLEDAMAHPEKYPQLTIRVSGYAVNFVRLTAEQQRDVISRTFHGAL